MMNDICDITHHVDHMKSPIHNDQQDGMESKMTKAKQRKANDGRPRRCLSAYNIFFGLERKRIMKEQSSTVMNARQWKKNKSRAGKHANVGFANLARIVSQRWKDIDTATKLKLEAMARKDRERYELEMEEWRMSENKRHLEVKEANNWTMSRAISDVAHSNKLSVIKDHCKNAYDDETKNEVFPYVTPSCKASSPKTTSKPSWDDTPKLPFKFETIDLSSSSILCLPCTENLSDYHQRQMSVMQPEVREYASGFSRSKSMDLACTTTQTFRPHPFLHGLDSGDSSTPSETTCMPCIPMTPLGMTHHNIPNNDTPIDLLMKDDVLRGLYESRMRRRASL